MASVDVGNRGGPPVSAGDDLDDLFNYDVDHVLRDVDANVDHSVLSNKDERQDGKENTANLGIDEEIKVTKKRAPVAKLDEQRLLSPAGIPKLRRIVKDRLRFKGKGHEYSDVARLLNMYQLWLDDLYPRAKFADGLAIIEKLGHSKRLQVKRKEWIDEGKSKNTPECWDTLGSKQDTQQQDLVPNAQNVGQHKPGAELQSSTISGGEKQEGRNTSSDALSRASANGGDKFGDSLSFPAYEESSHQPPDDDLDVILAEDRRREALGQSMTNPENSGDERRIDNFDDEMEAMAGQDDPW